jgi:class 3 adenylate cyclase/tetratricopeptide (TPR) repeat protein
MPVPDDETSSVLPYVPRLVLEWLRDEPGRRHRRIDGTLLFADISGFTALTETLARRGKVGAEEMGDILNRVFEHLLLPAYEHRGGLVKWGGDAVLLLFDGEHHVERAAASASRMQEVIEEVGRLSTSGGSVRLRMSIGLHAGPVDALLVGSVHRELIITGPAASEVAIAEKSAAAGEIVLSAATAARLSESGAVLGPAIGTGRRLRRPPPVTTRHALPPDPYDDVDAAVALPPPILAHVRAGPVEPEHRHVAVGFIEFSGADRLADRGPGKLADAVDALVSRCQGAAQANDVTLLSTDVNADGGKVILISGAPRRRGDDEARVLTALLAVLEDRGVLSVRAGASSGRVFAGDFGPRYRRVYSVAGDCVNLAARLMGSAAKGELLAAEPMADHVASRFDTRPVAPLALKGKAEPVPARRVRRLAFSRDRDQGADLPLVGREAELRRLLTLFDDVRRGTGRTVDLVGPAGIGKSRLLQELARACSAPVHWVDGDVYGEVTPYHPVRRFVRDRLGSLLTGAGAGAAFLDFVTESCPSVLPWLPLVGRVLDLDQEMTPEVSELEPAARKERLESALGELLAAIVAEPSVLVFNDAHLMDEATVDLLRRLTDDAPRRPWLLVTSYRPDERARIAERTVVITLEALSGPASEELLALATDATPLPPHVLQRLADRAAGNPLFLKELVAGTLAEDLHGELPSSVEEVIAVRIDRLRPPERAALRTASVLGMEVEVGLLAGLLAGDGPVPEDLDGVEGLLRPLDTLVEPTGEGRFVFRHQLMREVAYEGLPYRRRRELHGRAADLLESAAAGDPTGRAALLSLHCFHGQRPEAAWRYSVLAGDQARATYAMAEAADFYRRALAVTKDLGAVNPGADPEETTVRVAEALGDVCFELGEFHAAETALAQAHRRSQDPVTRARLCDRVALVKESVGSYPAAIRWMTKGRAHLSDVEGREAALLQGRLLVANARVRYSQGRYRQALRWAERARDHATAVDDELTLARALELVDLSSLALGEDTDPPLSLRSLTIYESANDLSAQARVHNSLGVRAYFHGRWAEARAHYTRAAEAYERIGRAWAAAISRANVAEVLSDQGRLAEAREVFEASVRVWRGIKADSEVAFGTYMLGRVAARSGRYADALAQYAKAREYCAEVGEHAELLTIDSYEAECLMLSGDAAGALSAVEALLDGGAGEEGHVAALLHRVRGQCLLVGDREEAVEALQRSLDAARRRDALHDVALALDVLVGATAAHPDLVSERDDLWHRLGMTIDRRLGPDVPAGVSG